MAYKLYDLVKVGRRPPLNGHGPFNKLQWKICVLKYFNKIKNCKSINFIFKIKLVNTKIDRKNDSLNDM